MLIAGAVLIALPSVLQAQRTGTSADRNEKKQAVTATRNAEEQSNQAVGSSGDRSRGGDFGGSPSNQQGPPPGYQMRSMPHTSWDFYKNLKDNSSTREYVFEVEKDTKRLSMSVSGMCKSGETKITVLLPGNKTYSDVKIDEHGNLNWKKSFELDEDSKDKIGVWKFKVATNKASGIFRISIQAY